MSKLKQHIYCNYMKYVEENYPHFKEYLDDTCTKYSLRLPRGRGIAGITILIPDNKELKQKIESGIEGETEEAILQAVDLMRCLIVHAYLPNAATWKAQMDDIPLSNGKKLKVTDVGKTITLDGGAVLTLDEKFKQREESSKVAIWVVKSGIPKDSGVDAEYKYVGSAKAKTIKGSNESPKQFNRSIYMNVILAAYEWIITGAKKGTEAYRNPLVEFSASLIDFIQNSSKYSEYLPDALCMCNFSYADIFLLLEPCNTTGVFLLPIELIDEWWLTKKFVNPAHAASSAFSAVKSDAACFTQRDKLAKLTNDYRDKHQPSVETFKQLINVYKSLSETNRLFGVDNVWPQRVYDRYRRSPFLKLNEDDIRFVLEVKFVNFEKRVDSGLGEFKDILGCIYSFDQNRDNLTERSARVINHEKLYKFSIPGLESTVEPIYNCNLVFYLPSSGEYVLDGHIDHIDGESGDVIDFNAYNYKSLQDIYGSGSFNMNDLLMAAMHIFCRHVNRYLIE